MAEWYVRFLARGSHNLVGEYSLANPEVELRNSDVGGFSGEIALGQTRRSAGTGITRDQFAPYRTHFEIFRQSSGSGTLITDGMITSVNLSFNRDTLLVSGKDWKHYLQRRVYPFVPSSYLTYDEEDPLGYWANWPKKWFDIESFDDIDELGEIPIGRVVRDLLASMRSGRAFDFRTIPVSQITSAPRLPGVPNITWNINTTAEPLVKYRIYPGDSTTIFDHIQALSEMVDKGFEWDITPRNLEFKMWVPRKFTGSGPAMTLRSTGIEADGTMTEFDWTNEGPEGTYLLGIGSHENKVGDVWEYAPSIEKYGRYDMVYDFGKMSNTDMILDKLKDQDDLHPQKKLSLSLLNPEYLTNNFYSGGRPRDLIGNTIQVIHNFAPYHTVNALFRVSAIKWAVDGSGNETVTLELEMDYEGGDDG